MARHRAGRIEEALKEALSTVIQSELRDPRMPGIFTVTGVKVTPDYSDARVYFTQIPEDEESIGDTLDALEGASGFLRKRLAQEVNLKSTPRLRFFHDDQARKADRIEELLEQEARKRRERGAEEE